MKLPAFLLLATAPLAFAAPPNPAQTVRDFTLWELISSAGWVMLPLFAVSVIVLTLVIFYAMTLRRPKIATDEFRRSLEPLIREKNFSGLYEAARANPQILARVMERTAEFMQSNPGAPIDTIREVAQAEGSRQVSSLTQQVNYLMDLGVLAPMLGLFGTVIGILRSFGSIASEATPMRTMVLAGGVSQALVATAAGLLVGITAMFFYAFFRGRVQSLISELESSATSLVALIGVKIKS